MFTCGVCGYPQAGFADIRGLDTAFFLFTTTWFSLSLRVLRDVSIHLTPNVIEIWSSTESPRLS